jgi:cysteate synthase
VYDALKDTSGAVFIADNDEAVRAGDMFEEVEGIDIDPAAAVALASLMNAVGSDQVDREAVIALNITGGGRRRLMATSTLVPVRPALALMPHELAGEGAIARIVDLFDR